MQTLENERSFQPMATMRRSVLSVPVEQSRNTSIADEPISIPTWKRALDLTLILLSAPLWLPLMILISLWITIVSPGTIFFTQTRIGLRGKPFKILKFRSMKESADTSSHEEYFDKLVSTDAPMKKLDSAGDRRIIFSGRLLRASGLDELPQLINVLKGDMSLVGPRPCTAEELSRYRMEQLERFDACPGLTGHWQVNGKNNTTFSRMIELDVFYARHASLRLDLKIILKTIPALLAQVRETRSGLVLHSKH